MVQRDGTSKGKGVRLLTKHRLVYREIGVLCLFLLTMVLILLVFSRWESLVSIRLGQMAEVKILGPASKESSITSSNVNPQIHPRCDPA